MFCQSGKGILMDKKLVCDVCSEEFKTNEGYILSTAQVIKSPGYWDSVARGGIMVDMSKLKNEEDYVSEAVKFIIGVVEHYASFRSGWLICEQCMKTYLQNIDPAMPREYAEEFWETGMEPIMIQLAPAPNEMDIAKAIEIAVKSFQPNSPYPLYFDKVQYLSDLFRRQ